MAQNINFNLKNLKKNGLPMHHTYEGIWYQAANTKEALTAVKEFEMDESDILVTTFIRSGTTWTQEIITLILNDADIEESKSIPIDKRFPFIEMQKPGDCPAINYISKMPSPRLIKSHLTPDFFEINLKKNKPKIVVTMRNPKDLLVSTYHFYRMNVHLGSFSGTWDQFFEVYKAGLIHGKDSIDFNVAWWAHRHHPNIFIIKYEDLLSDRQNIIKKLAAFLGKDITNEMVGKIFKATSFDEMKVNPAVNYANESWKDSFKIEISPFMRKGVAGDWKNYFNREQNEFVEARIKKLCTPVGLEFSFGN